MKNKKENSSYLLLASLMTFSLSLASIQYTDLEYEKVLGVLSILVLSFIFSILCKFIFKNIITFIISTGITLSSLSILYFFNFTNISEENSIIVNDFIIFLKEFIFNWSVGMDKPESFQKIMII